MTNPEVQHGKQPNAQPEVAVNGPLGETVVNIGGEQAPAADPELVAVPEQDDTDADTADTDAAPAEDTEADADAAPAGDDDQA